MELKEDHARKVEEREKVREPIKLLYETGPKLEEVVRSVMGSLGQRSNGRKRIASTRKTVGLRFGDQTFEGVLKIKGVRTKHFNTEGLMQLTTWIMCGISSRRKKYTGIFVGNSSREDPPRGRLSPFSKDWVEEAEMHGYAALRTEDLYVLYCLDQTGRLNRDKFWSDLFSTKGPLDMRPYRKKLTD